jgi:exonuclease III
LNIRGLGKVVRKQCILDVVTRENLDFIGIQETKQKKFSKEYLNALTRRKHFCWNWLPAIGSTGGILMVVNEDCFDVESWVIIKYSIRCEVCYKKDKSIFRVVTVYGTTYEEFKQDFLDELHS